MVTHTSSQGSQPVKLKSFFVLNKKEKSKKKLTSAEKTREFYRLAASLANPNQNKDVALCENYLPTEHRDLARSEFLDHSYQERSHLFCAHKTQWPLTKKAADLNAITKLMELSNKKELKNLSVISAQREKICFFSQPLTGVFEQGVYFSAREIFTLLRIFSHQLRKNLIKKQNSRNCFVGAINFHKQFSQLINQKNIFYFSCAKGGVRNNLLVDRARLFWSHRLRMKSLQERNGAEPSIRYFHATLFSSDPLDKTDIFYWLRFDEDQKIISGDFIEPSSNKLAIKGMFNLREVIKDQQKAENSKEDLIALALKLYQKSHWA